MTHYYTLPGLSPRPVIFNHNHIIVSVCDYFGYQKDDVMSKSRHQHLVDARHIIWHLLRERNMNLTTIARMFSRDHTTVIHGLRSVQNRLQVETGYKGMLDEIKGRL